MNDYERIIEVMRKANEKNKGSCIQKGIMQSDDTCKIGDLVLSKEDFLLPEPLKTGYFKNIDSENPSKKEESTFVKPLQKGDIVAAYRLNEEEYIILAKLVSL